MDDVKITIRTTLEATLLKLLMYNKCLAKTDAMQAMATVLHL
jgi:hypothetical protein